MICIHIHTVTFTFTYNVQRQKAVFLSFLNRNFKLILIHLIRICTLVAVYYWSENEFNILYLKITFSKPQEHESTLLNSPVHFTSYTIVLNKLQNYLTCSLQLKDNPRLNIYFYFFRINSNIT